MRGEAVRAIADAVLYEGYILWPYRRSALKNQRRFTFGGVYPPSHSARHPDDSSLMQSEVLLRAEPEAEVAVTVRFLQVVRRTVARRKGEALEPVDELVAGGERHLSWEEATEREVPLAQLALKGLRHREAIAIEGGRVVELLDDAGEIIRSWRGLRGEVAVESATLGERVWRLSVQI